MTLIQANGSRRAQMKVVVVGGGIIGLGCAWRLAQGGARVEVFEAAHCGRGASHVAAGMLGATAESSEQTPDFRAIAQESLLRWPAFAAELEAATGFDVDFRQNGTLLVADTIEAAKALREQLRADDDLRLVWLDRDEWTALEPGLSRGIETAASLANDGQVDSARVVKALRRAVEQTGATVRENAGVERLIVERGRVAGVQAGGHVRSADMVVLAAGAWSSGLLANIGLDAFGVGARPVKGQVIEVDVSACGQVPTRVIRCAATYVVPRLAGRLIVGATSEDAGFDEAFDAERGRQLLAAGAALIPSLRDGKVVMGRAGLRPFVPGRPLIGASGIAGLQLAFGHYRNGILLAPLTADLVARSILGTAQSNDLDLLALVDPVRRQKPNPGAGPRPNKNFTAP